MNPIRLVVGLSALILAAMLAAVPAQAATVTFMSWFYSADHAVPHIHYDGPVVDGDLDQLKSVFDSYVTCDLEQFPAEGGNCAVLSLNSPGGSYIEGLRLAQYLRDNRIASVVEVGSQCYSACAFAFLGGSGYSSQSRVGVYVDRVVEPEGILGFHAPYFAPDSLDGLVAEFGLDEVLGASRDDISLMVRQLVSWNVDENVLGYIVSMGPDETYDVVTGEDYFLTRTALPDTPLSLWGASASDPIRNVCTNLLAVHENEFPSAVMDRITDSTIQPIGVDASGNAISGIRLGPDNGLDVTFCGMPTAQLEAAADADIALYSGAGINGTISSILTYFHRPDGWSSLDAGGTASRSMFQKGAMNTLFLDITANLATGDQTVIDYINMDKFMTPAMLAGMADGTPYVQSTLALEVSSETGWSRTSRHGGAELVEQVGTRRLYDMVQQRLAASAGVEHQSVSAGGFIYTIRDTASASPYVWVGFLDGDEANVVRIDPLIASDGTVTQLDALYAIACSLTFKTTRLGCAA
ncbi:MAG: hypothetical protein KIT02_00600 [Devosia sp.]|uniref:hypothetical protein n=1 Tax=Devosia sp. TaxID=1871048 RepID=UPI0024C88247|nr:hypothetical protein [Devosia sp.]UYN99779.1 MAG: hypothetical protein KIT02_00600 [Devosia sp.]